MKVIELDGSFDENGTLLLDERIKIVNKQVKIIIMVPDEAPEKDQSWVEELSFDHALDFLEEDEEDEDFLFTDEGEPASDN